ncbi:hypothetical protein A8709_00525 [Paenibacillus pectinilyticus]|uniref:Uncharacterized protein n=1 Tax=Paenibacillus pectinilyticus TaxID=512399 RepID=A0A1C1A8G4_9BACL|nr:hypothetical protein [Paenibacillus pectinilyticus]OCT16839.1 hypothetical protein A8709_00525 [Paenibacillus pectinilyticus]
MDFTWILIIFTIGIMLLIPSLTLIAASTIASSFGANLSKKMNIKLLQWILAVLIMATVIKIWMSILA